MADKNLVKVIIITLIAGTILLLSILLSSYLGKINHAKCSGYAGILTCPYGYEILLVIPLGFLISLIWVYFAFKKIRISRFGLTFFMGSIFFLFLLSIFFILQSVYIYSVIYLLSYGLSYFVFSYKK